MKAMTKILRFLNLPLRASKAMSSTRGLSLERTLFLILFPTLFFLMVFNMASGAIWVRVLAGLAISTILLYSVSALWEEPQ